jgi:hypothetical protein
VITGIRFRRLYIKKFADKVLMNLGKGILYPVELAYITCGKNLFLNWLALLFLGQKEKMHPVETQNKAIAFAQ